MPNFGACLNRFFGRGKALSVNDVIAKLNALSTAAATSTELAELRKRMEEGKLEIKPAPPSRSSPRQGKRRPSTKPHGSSGGDGLSDDVTEELSAHLLRLNKRVDAWDDKMLQHQQIHILQVQFLMQS